MTDARFPDRWLTDRRLNRLSDADHRSFVNALVWAVSNRTDGRLDMDDLEVVPKFKTESIAAFEASGLWARSGEVWQIVEYGSTQTSAAQLTSQERGRVLTNARQTKHRANKSDADSDPDSPGVTRDVTHNALGQDRTGQAQEVVSSPSPVSDVTGWPKVTPPGSVSSLPSSSDLCPMCERPLDGEAAFPRWKCASNHARRAA